MKPTTGIVVDGSAVPNPGRIEWQGVDLATEKKVFKSKAYDTGTNNMAEFLGIIHGLSTTEGEVYSDSKTAICWIRVGKAMINEVASPEVITLMERANAKLKTMPDANFRTRFWDKKEHGENPADYGRK